MKGLYYLNSSKNEFMQELCFKTYITITRWLIAKRKYLVFEEWQYRPSMAKGQQHGAIHVALLFLRNDCIVKSQVIHAEAVSALCLWLKCVRPLANMCNRGAANALSGSLILMRHIITDSNSGGLYYKRSHYSCLAISLW